MQNSTHDPPHLGFPHSPFKAQFFQCAPQLAFKGKFVNPLETPAIGSFSKQHQAQKPSFHSFHSNRFARFVPQRLQLLSFHSFTLPLEPSLQGCRFLPFASAFLAPDSLPKPLPVRHRQYSETAKGTKLFALSITLQSATGRSVALRARLLLSFYSVCSSFRAFSAT
jgi:hypothetical protein